MNRIFRRNLRPLEPGSVFSTADCNLVRVVEWKVCNGRMRAQGVPSAPSWPQEFVVVVLVKTPDFRYIEISMASRSE